MDRRMGGHNVITTLGTTFVVILVALALAGEAADSHERGVLWAWLASLFLDD